jgi:hypothetical protein
MLCSWIGGIGESLQDVALDRTLPAQSHGAKYYLLRVLSTWSAAGSKSHEGAVIFIVKLLRISNAQPVVRKSTYTVNDVLEED